MTKNSFGPKVAISLQANSWQGVGRQKARWSVADVNGNPRLRRRPTLPAAGLLFRFGPITKLSSGHLPCGRASKWAHILTLLNGAVRFGPISGIPKFGICCNQ